MRTCLHVFVTWLISRIRLIDFGTCATWLVYTCDWLVHMCDMPHSYVGVTWLMDMYEMMNAYLPICICDMTHSCVRPCVTWRIHMCDMTHSYHECVLAYMHLWHDSFSWHDSFISAHVWRDSFIRVTWLVRMCDMPHSYVGVTWLIDMYEMMNAYLPVCKYDMTHLRDTTHLFRHMCDVTY